MEKSMRMVVDAEGNLTLPHMDSQLAKNIFINSDSDWGMATHEELIRSTGDMKQMLPLVNEKGNEGYYQSAEYVFDKGKRYDTFRQNNYYGEFMLNVMGYHMGNRKFERD